VYYINQCELEANKTGRMERIIERTVICGVVILPVVLSAVMKEIIISCNSGEINPSAVMKNPRLISAIHYSMQP
jgi:hypothetical protein